MPSPHPMHPLGSRARVLLSSVFGPFARDDVYGSRSINPMELYHNQVTRLQGVFSLRMFHRSFGLMMLQANIDAPCTLLDFPSRDRFIQELRSGSYDVVGIGAIVPNIGKVKEMCELARRHRPGATIVIGGHIAGLADLETRIDADHIVRGDGIQWFRRYLSQKEDAPIRHPMVYSGFGTRILGVRLKEKPGDTAAILIPSVGCPVGCNFCCTSALFGGKGRFVDFYRTGDALFSIMCGIEETLKVRSFFVLDENFLLHRKRALRLLELMARHGKSWALYVFSSARVLKSYPIDTLVRLGVAWVWMGIEGENSRYQKLRDIDTRLLVRELQSHGIRVLGSSIIGLETHTPENIDRVIDDAVSHATDFHQFMLYTPMPGTPFHERMAESGGLLPESEFGLADTHGQFRFNYRHPAIRDGREQDFLLDAFRRDFQVNGPSLVRLIETLLAGWQRHKNHPDRRVRSRFKWEAAPLKTTYAGAVWAMKNRYRDDETLHGKLKRLLLAIYREFGLGTRITAPLVGRYLLRKMAQEEKRLACGWAYEPETFYEKNAAAMALEAPDSSETAGDCAACLPLEA